MSGASASREASRPVRRILVTGASGNVGAQTVRALLERARADGAAPDPFEIAAAVRDPARYRPEAPNLRAVRLDFSDPAGWDGALEGADAVFLVRPPEIADVDAGIGPFVDRAAARGVRKIVFLSLIGVESMPYVPHHKIEARIRSGGTPFVFLRPSFFMQNLSTTHRAEIAGRDEIFVPAGRGRTNFIDVRDIGDAAAKVLLETGHEGRAYELTGGESLDYFEIARVLSEVLGRPIRYARPSLPRFLVRSVRNGTPFPYALVMAGLYAASALGTADRTTDELERLLGRKPRDFRTFAEDARGAWSRP